MILWPKHVDLSMAAGQLRCAWGLGLSWRGAARPFCWRRISDDFWVLNLWNSGEWRHVLLSTNDMLYYAGLKHARIAFQNGSRVIVITTFYNITQARELRMHGFSRDPDPAWSRLLRVPLMPLRPRRADVEFYLNVAFTFKTRQNSITYYLPIKADLRWFVRCFQVFPGVSRCLLGFWVFADGYLNVLDILRLFEAQIDSAQGQPGGDLGIMCHVVETEQLAVEKICHLVHHLASEFGQILLCGRFNDSTRIPLVWFVVSISFNSD